MIPRVLGRPLVAGLVLGAAGLVAGCQPVQAGAAVIVGDDRIAVSQIEDRVEKVVAERERAGQQAQEASAITSEQVQRIVLSRILARAAERVGTGVTQAEIDANRIELQEQVGGADAFAKQVANANIAPGDLNGFLRDNLLSEKIGAKLVPGAATAEQQQERSDKVTALVKEVARGMHIKVNPRFGRWDYDQFTLTPSRPAFVKAEQGTAAAEATPSQ